jgi:hypothetical protein
VKEQAPRAQCRRVNGFQFGGEVTEIRGFLPRPTSKNRPSGRHCDVVATVVGMPLEGEERARPFGCSEAPAWPESGRFWDKMMTDRAALEIYLGLGGGLSLDRLSPPKRLYLKDNSEVTAITKGLSALADPASLTKV